ncbi:MAG TPA: peptidoglycan-binding domain-containing protein [candidate division Zixibacteria bacterium]|nr:peptidoglycan-binding domain-containing protein [candidate division Zixibacteria bacterium]
MATQHRCANEDHISKIAAQHGFADWKTVWDSNGDLKSKRKNPNLLFKGDKLNKGDVVKIPDPKVGSDSGSTGSTLSFELVGQTLFLRMRILKDDFTALPNAEYELYVAWRTAEGAEAKPIKGKTDGNGQIEVEIPRTTIAGTLKIRVPFPLSESAGSPGAPAGGAQQGEVPVSWDLQIGAMNPILEKAPDAPCISGVQQRLNNLGLNTGPIDGIKGPNTTAAIKAFQKLFKLSESGNADQTTQQKLEEVHDKADSIKGPAPAATA